MQNYSQDLKQQLWLKLFQVFNRYTTGKHQEITLEQLGHLIREVLHEDGTSEIGYVIKHMTQIDSNHNGSIEFDEFANYILKRHCGEMALQNMHKYKLSMPMSDMKITRDEMFTLFNDAFSFVSVSVTREVSDRLFDQLDSNKDELVSYVEYYRFIEAFICETELSPSQNNRLRMSPVKVRRPVEEVSEVLIRFRRLLWGQLFRIYIRYDSDGNGHMDDAEMTLLLKELLNETTKSELDYVFKNAFRMDQNGDQCFVFEEFSHFFIKHSCEVGLNRFNRSRPTGGRRDINPEDFLKLFRNCFCYLQLYIMTDELVGRVFQKIDKDKDGVISYKEYLQWTNELLTYREPCGMPCFLSEPKIEEIIFYTPMKAKPGEESPRSSARRRKEEEQQQKRQKYIKERDRYQRERYERERQELNKFDKEKHRKVLKEEEEMERLQRQRDERNRKDIQRIEREQAQKSRQDKMQQERDKLQRERSEKMRLIREREEFERQQKMRKQRQRKQKQKDDQERSEIQRAQQLYLESQKRQWERIERARLEQEGIQRDRIERERRQRQTHTKPPLYGRSNNQSVNSSADKSVSFQLPLEVNSARKKSDSKEDDELREALSHRNRVRSAIKGADLYGSRIGEIAPKVIVFGADQDNQSIRSHSQTSKGKLSRATFIELGSSRMSESSVKSFSYRNLAERIRQHTLRILRTFDLNKNDILDQSEIQEVLNHLLKEDEIEVKYVTRNFLRYKESHADLVRFQSFVNFFLGLHCGEMAVQRFHVKGMYSRGKDLLMNRNEFIMSFQGALDFVEFLAPLGQLKRLFSEIDEDCDGWISYKEYFEFLKLFFSYLPKSTVDVLNKYPSLASTPRGSPGASEREPSQPDDHTLEETIGSLIRNQTIALLNRYANPQRIYPRSLLPRILKEAFNMEQSELEYCLLSFSKYDLNRDGALSADELANLIIEVYCGQVVLQRLHREKTFIRHQERLLGTQEFMLLMEKAFSYLSFKPRREDLIAIFKNIDSSQIGFIGYGKYSDFIKEHVSGSSFDCRSLSHKKNTTTTSPGGSNLTSSNVRSTDQTDQPEQRARQTSTFFRV